MRMRPGDVVDNLGEIGAGEFDGFGTMRGGVVGGAPQKERTSNY